MLRGRMELLAVTAALALVACSGGDGGGLATVPDAGSTVGSLPVRSTVVSSGASSTTSPVIDTTVAASTSLPAGIGLSADGPWRLVESAPGVTTPGLVYELMPKLWAFIQVEETEQSFYPWVLTEADRPIIEAYLMAQLTYYEAITTDPINLDHPGWTEYYAGESDEVEDLRDRAAVGQVADLDLGVVLRPQVITDERTASTAIVVDCVLDGAVFRSADGSLAPGSTEGVVSLAWGARLGLVNGVWLVTQVGPAPGVCQ